MSESTKCTADASTIPAAERGAYAPPRESPLPRSRRCVSRVRVYGCYYTEAFPPSSTHKKYDDDGDTQMRVIFASVGKHSNIDAFLVITPMAVICYHRCMNSAYYSLNDMKISVV